MKKEKNKSIDNPPEENRGRKRDDIWFIFKETEEILTGKYKQIWEQRYGDKKACKHVLLMHVLNSILRNVKISKIKDYSSEEIKQMEWEVKLLLAVYGNFTDELEKAKTEKNTLFINTVRKFLHEQSYFLGLDKKSKGRNINSKTFVQRINKVKEYINDNKTLEDMGIGKTGTFYKRDKLTYLCYLALNISRYLHFDFPHPPKYETEKTKAIEEIKKLVYKYNILCIDIPFPVCDQVLCLAERGANLQDIDTHIKRCNAFKKLISQ